MFEGTVRKVIETKPDTVIISVFERSSSLTAIKLLEELAILDSASHAIVLSAYLTNDEAVAYLRAQARGVLSGTTADFAALRKCVQAVHAGQIWANSEQMVCLVQSFSKSKRLNIVNAKDQPILSAREEEVLRSLADGLSNRDIAAKLKLSEYTVRNHLFHIFDKLGVSSRMEALVFALDHLKNPMQLWKRNSSSDKLLTRRANGVLAVNE